MIKRLQALRKNKNATRLASNALMLYFLTFSNYILYLITIPYQTRVLGPELFGQVNFAMSFALYFQIIIEFGFMILGTEMASKHRENKQKLSQLLTSIMACRLALAVISALTLLALCLSVAPFNEDFLLYGLFFMSSVFAAMMPDFIYRGMENMKIITIRTVIIRTFFMILIFILLTSKDDYRIVALLTFLGNASAFAFSIFDLKKRGILINKVKIREAVDLLKRAAPFFASRIATNVYSASNTFLLGLAYGANSKTTGFYASADRLVVAAKSGMTPIIDTTYPYMVKHRNFRLIKKILIAIMPIITIACAAVAIFAENIAVILFGQEYAQAGQYLRLMVPVIWLAFPAMLFGFPTLTPMGLSTHANKSNVYGALLHILQLAILFAIGKLTVITICLATVVTEVFTISYRLAIVYKYRDRMRND